tara:strand:+ start:621 stop:800 length:180 start_codon:yes stop_codon:yes gene_type:complete
MRIIWYPAGRDLWFDLAVKLTWEDILKSSSSRSEQIHDWLAATLTAHVIPITVNPSNER